MTLKTHFFHLLNPNSGEMLTVKVKTTEEFVFARNRASDAISAQKMVQDGWSTNAVISALKDVFEEVSVI